MFFSEALVLTHCPIALGGAGAGAVMELESVEQVETPDMDGITTSLTRLGAWNLYISHALSTWNVRTYEFAAVSLHSYSLPVACISKYDRLSSRHMRSLILYLLRRYGKLST